jgi:hypothetical protein
MIVHIQTSIQTVFGVVNEDGDTVQQVPVNLTIPALKGELFTAAVEHLVAQKAKLAEGEKNGEVK